MIQNVDCYQHRGNSYIKFGISDSVEEIVNAIKSTDQDITKWNYDGDTKRWRMRHIPSKILQIQKNSPAQFPSEVYRIEEPLVFRIQEDGLYIDLDEIPSHFIEELKAKFSYKVEKYDNHRDETYTRAESLVEDGKLPIGLQPRLEEFLSSQNLDYNLIDRRKTPESNKIDLSWNFAPDGDVIPVTQLRGYQKEAVSKCSQGSQIVQIPTGGGKTIVALAAIYMKSQPSLILVHRKELLKQWQETIREVLGVEPGIIQGKNHQIRNITVAMIQTLTNTDYKIDDFDIVVVDEAHHVPASTFNDVLMRTSARYRYGLSATLDGVREDDKDLLLYGGITSDKYKVTAEHLIEEGYLAEPEFMWLKPSRFKPSKNWDSWQDGYQWGIVEKEDRNELIANAVHNRIVSGQTVLVDVKRLEHGQRILKRFETGLVRGDDEVIYDTNGDVVAKGRTEREALDIAIEKTDNPVVWMSGEDPGEIRDLVMKEFRSGGVSCVISTLLGEGVDVPEMDTVVMAGGMMSSIQTIQTAGRALRPGETGKATIIDCVDQGPLVGKHRKERMQIYREYYGEYFSYNG